MWPLNPYPRDATIHLRDSRPCGRHLGVCRGRPPGRHVHRPSLDRWLALSIGFGSAPFLLGAHAVVPTYVVTIRYGELVLSIAYRTHNSFRATATMARFPPERLAIRS